MAGKLSVCGSFSKAKFLGHALGKRSHREIECASIKVKCIEHLVRAFDVECAAV